MTAILLGVVGPAAVVALLAVHFVTRAGGNSTGRTYKPAPTIIDPDSVAWIPDDDDLLEHQGVDERGLDGYVAIVLDLDERPAGPLLCDRPLCPPHGSEAWWAVRHGRARQLDRLRLACVGHGTLPPWFLALVNRESRILAAQDALFHHLTDVVFEPTAEHELVGAPR